MNLLSLVSIVLCLIQLHLIQKEKEAREALQEENERLKAEIESLKNRQ